MHVVIPAVFILDGLAAARLAWLFLASPGRADPLRDAAGSVVPGSTSERVTVEIGGIRQGMFIQVADAAPERFRAYVGMGQIAHQLRSEVMARDSVLGLSRARGDSGMIHRPEAAPAGATCAR